MNLNVQRASSIESCQTKNDIDWEFKKVEEIFHLQRGFDLTKSESINGDYPVVTSSGISYYHNQWLVKPPGVVTGRKGKIGTVFLLDKPFWPHDTSLWVKDFKGNDPCFIYYLIINLKLSRLDEASAVPTLNRNNVYFLESMIPVNIYEQKAIAQALSDADALIEALEQLIAKKRLIKQGAMQQLLTGKKRLPGFETQPGFQQTEVGEIPVDWDVYEMGTIGTAFIGLTYHPSQTSTSGKLVLRSSNIQNGVLNLKSKDSVFVNMSIPNRAMVKLNDILICVRNGSRSLIGKCALISPLALNSAFGAFMAVYRSKYNNFIFYQFQSRVIKYQIGEILGATINQITNKDLNSFKIPLPPTKAEQEAIAKVLSDMDAEIEALTLKLDKYRKIKQGMMHNLLTGRIRLV